MTVVALVVEVVVAVEVVALVVAMVVGDRSSIGGGDGGGWQ